MANSPYARSPENHIGQGASHFLPNRVINLSDEGLPFRTDLLVEPSTGTKAVCKDIDVAPVVAYQVFNVFFRKDIPVSLLFFRNKPAHVPDITPEQRLGSRSGRSSGLPELFDDHVAGLFRDCARRCVFCAQDGDESLDTVVLGMIHDLILAGALVRVFLDFLADQRIKTGEREPDIGSAQIQSRQDVIQILHEVDDIRFIHGYIIEILPEWNIRGPDQRAPPPGDNEYVAPPPADIPFRLHAAADRKGKMAIDLPGHQVNPLGKTRDPFPQFDPVDRAVHVQDKRTCCIRDDFSPYVELLPGQGIVAGNALYPIPLLQESIGLHVIRHAAPIGFRRPDEREGHPLRIAHVRFVEHLRAVQPFYAPKDGNLPQDFVPAEKSPAGHFLPGVGHQVVQSKAEQLIKQHPRLQRVSALHDAPVDRRDQKGDIGGHVRGDPLENHPLPGGFPYLSNPAHGQVPYAAVNQL